MPRCKSFTGLVRKSIKDLGEQKIISVVPVSALVSTIFFFQHWNRHQLLAFWAQMSTYFQTNLVSLRLCSLLAVSEWGKVSVSLVTAVTFPSECQKLSLCPAELWISPRVKDRRNRSMQTNTEGCRMAYSRPVDKYIRNTQKQESAHMYTLHLSSVLSSFYFITVNIIQTLSCTHMDPHTIIKDPWSGHLSSSLHK